MTKFIFVTGGVVSSLGKGISISSIAVLLKSQGYKIRIKKLDPYLNIDPGTMNPIQHGEVFVTCDGAETDLDLGHYERFTGISAKKTDSITSGKIYSKLLTKERSGDYLGITVQVIPHVTNLIKEFILNQNKYVDFILCEIGGTVGDIEGLPYFETIKQIRHELGKNNAICIHLTLVPYLKHALELKTKPTQHSVRELRSTGVQPDIVLCRGEKKIPEHEKKKIGLFCNIEESNIIQSQNLQSIYKIPLVYHKEKVDKQILKIMKLPYKNNADLCIWKDISGKSRFVGKNINIAIITKYHSCKDSYKSIIESFKHVEIYLKNKIQLIWIKAESISDNNALNKLNGIDGILIPGGFGNRGINGKIAAIKFARTKQIPLLGICLGMQLAVIEFARNVLNIKSANSSEFSSECINIFHLIKKNKNKSVVQLTIGGTLRLGSCECYLQKNTKIQRIYKTLQIKERHRHRYEFNTKLINKFIGSNLKFSAKSFNGEYIEAIELQNHPWFIGVQYHPEYKSRPFTPHPLFISFVKSMINIKNINK